MNKELKPCPFCGGEAALRHEYVGDGYSYVACLKCSLVSPRFMRAFDSSSDLNATNYWNTRISESVEENDNATD